MVKNKVFRPDQQKVTSISAHSTKKRTTIIKQGDFKMNSLKTIKPHDEDEYDSDRAKIKPIEKNNEIVGLIVECCCGKTTKVYFEFL